jgi:HAD superfamily hydrolase (TIGR01490 family)
MMGPLITELADVHPRGKAAAFFDVDGTIVRATIVHYYVWLRSLLLPPLLRSLWLTGFALKIVYYFFLDKVSRTKFNRIFYCNYRGLEAKTVKRLAQETFSTYVRSRLFPAALNRIREHRAQGNLVVLVTGSLDFIIQPLGDHLQVDDALTVQLDEVNGKFTGELTTPPLGEDEKARAIRAFAAKHRIDLVSSYAYGDSRADVPMLRCVGNPIVINPGKALRRIAIASGWKIQEWTLDEM